MNRLGLGLLLGAALVAGPATCSLYDAFTSVTTAPGRVISKTMQTDNIIHNYELFFDLNQQYKARISQAAKQRQVLADETDPAEKRRLRMELSAMEQSCRDLAAEYDANSQKENRALFKSRNLPEELICPDA